MFEYIIHSYFDLGAAFIGLLFLYFEFKANINMWLVSILMALLFIYVFWTNHLYASMCIYIYFLCASIYGWLMWCRDREREKTALDIIYRLPFPQLWIVLLFIGVSFGCIYLLLHFGGYVDDKLRMGDSLTTSLNMVAIWMLSRKWAEQWLLLIPANLISGLLLQHQDSYPTAIMFYIYALVSLIGFIYWCRLAKGSRKKQMNDEY